ncbi:SPOR domain-containing protein [Lewinella sp. IMCC34191]|uniref:SPOR domain-containing protein n=1 Tax=Lewinella sp. IMCC34191 TaxID=2259172 RepID=UPI000E274A46|nr:SPOR domain-containing protein [Lewinella sp. IMCC34191]
MKKTSILIPLILVVCLIALALLVSQAIAASEQSQTGIEDKAISSEHPRLTPDDSLNIRDSQRMADGSSTTQNQRFQDLVPATSADDGVTSNSSNTGNFFVIAGTFRQQINARTRVRNLKSAGFDRTALEIFDRGKYAVALVDHTESYGEAAELAQRVRSAGFEVEVYRKR